MLIVDGALAVWNGLLVATGRIWCECVRGGTCCGGECRCDEGVCCGEVWHSDQDPNEPCEEGEVFLQWCLEDGIYRRCGCAPETTYDCRVDDDVNTVDLAGELCCCEGPLSFGYDVNCDFVGCTQRCCTDGDCENTLPQDCEGESLASCCEDFGCPKSCCTENSSGVVSCDTVDELLCTGVVDPEPCETACKGACCIDGELTESSPTTQAECDEVDGCWWGIGSTECGTEGFCRAPFDDDCCESVESSAELLTFTGPRKRRCPELAVCGVQVTVEVTTRAPIYVHGGLFGAGPYEACTDEVTFTVCNDQFHIAPAPCSGNLPEVNVKACWDDDDEPSELLRFRCCQDITHLIGNCDCDCVTTVLYEEGGCTSNAAFVMRGDATIDASGTGALLLTGNISQENSCERTLTLTGSNQDNNELSGVIQSGGGGTSVFKTGAGLWRLSGASEYSGQLRVLDGTLVLAVAVTTSGGSPFGDANTSQDPEVEATLLAEGVSVERPFSVPASGQQTVVIGNTGSGTSVFSGAISLGRSVTLQSSTGGIARFTFLLDTAGTGVEITIGSAGNAGTVALQTTLASSFAAVTVVNGTALLEGANNRINSATPVTVGSATLDLNSLSQTLSDLTFSVGSGSITGGTLRLTGTVATTGTGHTISSAVALDAAVTFSGSGELTISGVVSGSESLTYSGTGTLILSGANTYTGGTTINAGTAIAGNLAAFGTGGITVNAGGTLNKGGFLLENSITNNGGIIID